LASGYDWRVGKLLPVDMASALPAGSLAGLVFGALVRLFCGGVPGAGSAINPQKKFRGMIRHVKRYLAIRSYARRLSRDLVRRFGKRPFYSVEQISTAVHRGGYSAAFVAYAHATFCSQADFDAHYGPLRVACTYEGLRRVIGRRYMSGRIDFDAAAVARKFAGFECGRGEFYESGIGENYPGNE
jgi:hypothetical protein